MTSNHGDPRKGLVWSGIQTTQFRNDEDNGCNSYLVYKGGVRLQHLLQGVGGACNEKSVSAPAWNLQGEHKTLQAQVSGGQTSKMFGGCNYLELLPSCDVHTFTQPSALSPPSSVYLWNTNMLRLDGRWRKEGSVNTTVHMACKAFFVVGFNLICQENKLGQVGGRVSPRSRELENLSFKKNAIWEAPRFVWISWKHRLGKPCCMSHGEEPSQAQVTLNALASHYLVFSNRILTVCSLPVPNIFQWFKQQSSAT